MAKNLVIVESPAKAKTIQGYLGKDYAVIATVGHLIDLPTSKLGVDITNSYEMDYTTIKGKDKVIKEIQKKIAETTGTVYLSPDPDREGESIAWQVVKICKLEKQKDKVKRAVFHEITKGAIQEAIEKTREVDGALVEAQQSRRILDRLVGYPLSMLLWKKIQFGLSAGRVQSAALRLVVEREDEIRAFIPTPFVTFFAKYNNSLVNFPLVDKNGSLAKLMPEVAGKLKQGLDSVSDHEVIERKTKAISSAPPAPLVTSTMQQAANKVFGFTAKMTMKVAQELYQGIDVKDKGGRMGLISYMRTDSLSISEQAITAIRAFIKQKYGNEFLNEEPRHYKTKSKVAQEAHEAIRPTHVELSPDKIRAYLTPQQYKLYSLIWRRTVATQMKPQLLEEESIKALPTKGVARDLLEEQKLVFEATSTRELFAGYRLLKHAEEKDLPPLPQVKKGDSLSVKEIVSEEKMTIPPGRFNDASLIKEMEKLGIGRPSTYATIIGTIISRNYVSREMKLLIPTDIGMLVCNFLKKNFPQIVDYTFTASMEQQLDEIANSKLTKKKMLDDFYPAFSADLTSKEKTIQKEELVVLSETEKPCRTCGTMMVLKIGPWGKYYSCPKSGCKTTEPFLDLTKYFVPEEVKAEGFILKKSRFGMFWAHPDYPNVKKTLPLLLNDICPDCGAHLVERKGKTGRTFTGCSAYPACKYIKSRFFKKYEKKGDAETAAKPKVAKRKSTAKPKNAKAKTKRAK
jgi:DNA topoisomerase-1